MKKFLPLLLLLPTATFADITQKFTTSAQITVDMPYSVTNKLGTTYSLSGNNITPSAITPSSGISALPHLGGQTTVGSGGTAGSLGMTSLSSGVHTCTAGGSGTSCIGQTTVTITID